MAVQYQGWNKWLAITAWAALTTYSVGDIRRQVGAAGIGGATTASGNERAFRCTTAGITGAAEPTWVLTHGATTSDGTAVWTEVTGQSAYGWNAAHATAFAATQTNWMAAGDDLYTAASSNEPWAAALTITFPGTIASPNRWMVVPDAASIPPLSSELATITVATAQITTTGASGILCAGQCWVSGMIFNTGTGSSAANFSMPSVLAATTVWRLSLCAINLITTSSSSSIIIQAGTDVFWGNTTVSFGSTGQGIRPNGCNFSWKGRGSGVTGSTFPTSFIQAQAGKCGTVVLERIDLSNIGSGKTLIGQASAHGTKFRLVNCKINASVTIAASPPGPGALVDIISTDDSTKGYRRERRVYEGTLTTETTIIRTGGYTDGTTPSSDKIVTTANVTYFSPCDGFEFAVENDVVGSPVTLTVELNCATQLTTADIRLLLSYQDSASHVMAADAAYSAASGNGLATVLETAANLTASAASWAGSLGGVGPQKISVTFTPQMVGLVRGQIKVAKPSLTVYVDPMMS